MCLTSCEFKGKAISLINGCKRSVWYVFVHVANFSVSLANGNQDWLKIRQSKKIFAVHSQVSYFLEARFSFSPSPLYAHFIVGLLITGVALRWAA